MKITYVGKGGLSSAGYSFQDKGEYTVKETVGKYLLETFPSKFEGELPKKASTKTETKSYKKSSDKTSEED